MLRRILIAFFAALTVIGCTKKSPSGEGKPVIVVSIFPLQSLVKQLVGEQADVICLLPIGVSSHGYEMNPAQRNAVNRADLIVTIGPGIDDWAEALARSQKKSQHLSMSVSLGLKASAGADHDHHGHDHDHEHEHAGPNPHLWLDPASTEVFVRKHLGPRVQSLLGLPADTRLADELKALDEELGEQLKPFAGGKLITYHNAFDPLAEHYGLQVAATLTAVSAPGQLTPARINHAIEVIKKFQVHTVYIEPQFPPEAANVLKNEAGVSVMMLDPLGDPNDPRRDSYQNVMRFNVQAIINGLKAPAPAQP